MLIFFKKGKKEEKKENMLFIQEQTSSLPLNFPWAPSLMPLFSPRCIPVICQEIYRKFLFLKNGANTRITILPLAFPINSTYWTSFHYTCLLLNSYRVE